MSDGLYYDDGRVQLYQGDCLVHTQWLEADVLVFDPPYGRNWKQGPIKGTRAQDNGIPSEAIDGIAGDSDTAVRDAVLQMWGDRPAIVFGDLMLSPPPGVRLVGTYRKPADAGMRGAVASVRRDLEAIYFCGKWPNHPFGGRSGLFQTAAPNIGGPSGIVARSGGHPHAKPLDVLEQLLALCPPGTIGDPTFGSGNGIIAARNMGRNVIGCELEPKWCQNAGNRLLQDCLEVDTP